MPLTAGTLFCIEERELRRFRTEDQRLDVIAFHPDGDWGLTDQITRCSTARICRRRVMK